MNARDPPCLPLAVGERGPSGHRPVAVWWMTRAGTGLPSSAHRAGTLVSAWPIDARARRKFAGVILNGAPPSQPCSRADARPAFVRSEMSARSNSAMAAKIPRTSSPETVVVVAIAAPCPVKTSSDYVTASWPLFRGYPALRPARLGQVIWHLCTQISNARSTPAVASAAARVARCSFASPKVANGRADARDARPGTRCDQS